MTESLAGRYDRIASLGRGAMGEVWLATDRVLGRQVAIKKILAGQLGNFDGHAADRIVREARVAARIHHPNVVAVFDLITEDGQPFVIMEYVRGQTLAERIRQCGRLDSVELLPILGGLVDALETAHRAEVTHRDIKPANIMIDDDGRAKLADFGIARGLGDGSLTETGSMLGTVAYMAPEVARGEVATPASDVYSLGATIFAAVEGRPPHVERGQLDNSAAILARLVTRPAPQAEHAGLLTELLSQMLSSSASARPTAGEVRRRVSELIASRLDSAASPPAAGAIGPAGKHSEVEATSMRLLPVEPTVIRAQPPQGFSGSTGPEHAAEEPEQPAAAADEDPPDETPEQLPDQTLYRDQRPARPVISFPETEAPPSDPPVEQHPLMATAIPFEDPPIELAVRNRPRRRTVLIGIAAAAVLGGGIVGAAALTGGGGHRSNHDGPSRGVVRATGSSTSLSTSSACHGTPFPRTKLTNPSEIAAQAVARRIVTALNNDKVDVAYSLAAPSIKTNTSNSSAKFAQNMGDLEACNPTYSTETATLNSDGSVHYELTEFGLPPTTSNSTRGTWIMDLIHVGNVWLLNNIWVN